MSFSITEAFVNQFKSGVALQMQQSTSRLRPYVTEDPLAAEFGFFDRLGSVEAYERTSRHTDLNYLDPTHSKRSCGLRDFVAPVLIDHVDKLRTLNDPSSPYAATVAAALQRKIDRVIIDGAKATAYEGKTRGSAIQFDSNRTIAANYVESGSATASNLTLGKLRRAKFLLESAEAVQDGEPIVCAYTASQKQALLAIAQVLSADYTTIKALETGEHASLLGMNFVRTELLNKAGNNRSCLIFPKSGMQLCVGEDINVIIERVPTKDAWQILGTVTADAVRMWEERVIEVLCDETIIA